MDDEGILQRHQRTRYGLIASGPFSYTIFLACQTSMWNLRERAGQCCEAKEWHAAEARSRAFGPSTFEENRAPCLICHALALPRKISDGMHNASGAEAVDGACRVLDLHIEAHLAQPHAVKTPYVSLLYGPISRTTRRRPGSGCGGGETAIIVKEVLATIEFG